MKILLIGASGFIGSAILKEALVRGHYVKAVVRHPGKIEVKDNRLTIEAGDVSSPDLVAEVCKGADVVISAYNPGWTNPELVADTLKVHPSIIEGVKRSGVKRLLIAGGAGSLFVSPGVTMMDAGLIPESYLPAVKALASIYYDVLSKERKIDWVFFSPAGNIYNGERTNKFRLGKDDLVKDAKGNSSISVQDYAVAMIDEAEKPAHHMERFTIGY